MDHKKAHCIWHIFFAAVSVTIASTMMMPWAFGLQHSTQWGGMYIDGWCGIEIWNEDTGERDFVRAPTTPPAWYATMHSRRSCIAWAQSWCGVQHQGRTVTKVVPDLHQKNPLGSDAPHRNACDLPPLSHPWYIR